MCMRDEGFILLSNIFSYFIYKLLLYFIFLLYLYKLSGFPPTPLKWLLVRPPANLPFDIFVEKYCFLSDQTLLKTSHFLKLPLSQWNYFSLHLSSLWMFLLHLSLTPWYFLGLLRSMLFHSLPHPSHYIIFPFIWLLPLKNKLVANHYISTLDFDS